MRQLQQALRTLSGRGVYLQSEPKNKIILTGATDRFNSFDMTVLKINKPLLVLMLPEGKSFSIELIIKALSKIIERSDTLIANDGCELHSADIRALHLGRVYLDTANNN